ncbi:hypothetical protein BpHYR1_015329, partial [Brachionus plicatilis]
MKLMAHLNSWRTILPPPTSTPLFPGHPYRDVSDYKDTNIVQPNITCHYCKKPGHFIAECQARLSKINHYRQGKHPNGYLNDQHPPTVSNVVINSVICEESIQGDCNINGRRVRFLFDTGTVKTIVSERVWKQVSRNDIKVRPIYGKMETCNGGPLLIVGASKCQLQLQNFCGQVEVIIVKQLKHDCLLGLDVAFKISTVKTYLNLIREAFGGSLPANPQVTINTTESFADLPKHYQPLINAVSTTKPPESDEKVLTEKKNTEEEQIEIFNTILRDEYDDIVSQ